ncbi:hypothetical protein GQR58_002485 [Nymphon striatum]|nr:hypothetical protein GQR58_002485 [Nymphon striatum]
MMKSFVIESAQYLLWPILMNSCFSLQQFGPILDVEIIFNERGSKHATIDFHNSFFGIIFCFFQHFHMCTTVVGFPDGITECKKSLQDTQLVFQIFDLSEAIMN